MKFTFPCYVSIDASTRELGRIQVEQIFKQAQLTKTLSYTISQPINSPDTPSCPKPKLAQK